MNNDRNYTGFWVKDAITTVACTLLLLTILSACNDSTNTPVASAPAAPTTAAIPESFSLHSILNSIEGATSGVQDAVGPHAGALQARTKEEVDKLFRWEYKVVEVSTSIQTAELETQLGALGAEGWECFDLQPQPSNVTRITCKRRPKSAISYLKYIPGL